MDLHVNILNLSGTYLQIF